MTHDEKLSLIASFESAVEPLIQFVKDAPPEAIDFRPDLLDAWTMRDHAVHFLDADVFAYTRLRLAVCQPGVEVFVWNENTWQERARYQTADALASLDSARSLRHVLAEMARGLVDADWETFYVRHAVRGRMTFSDVLTLYTGHADFHLSYLRRNLDAFRSSKA
jgi:hypothetical protein